MSEAADTPWGRLLVHRQTLGFDHPMSNDLLAASQYIRQLEERIETNQRMHRYEVDRLTNMRTLGLQDLQRMIARLAGVDDEQFDGLSAIDIHMHHTSGIRVTTHRNATSAVVDATDDLAASRVSEVFKLVPTGEIMEWSNA